MPFVITAPIPVQAHHFLQINHTYLDPGYVTQATARLIFSSLKFESSLSSVPYLPTAMEKRTPSLDKEEKTLAEIHEKQIFNVDIDTSGVDERKLIRKLDMALIPWLSFLYLLSFLDRTSIGKSVCIVLFTSSMSLRFLQCQGGDADN